MESLCGTSGLLMYPVLGIGQSYVKNGWFTPHLGQTRTWTDSSVIVVIATVVYGDVTHFPFMPWNKGTCQEGLGVSNYLTQFLLAAVE